jgi:adenylylsulfate kinase
LVIRFTGLSCSGKTTVGRLVHGLWKSEAANTVIVDGDEVLHRMNREVLSRYFEVFIDVPMEALKKSDGKNLYGPALRGETRNVMGMDLPFTPPADPGMAVDNSADGIGLGAVAADILARAKAS